MFRQEGRAAGQADRRRLNGGDLARAVLAVVQGWQGWRRPPLRQPWPESSRPESIAGGGLAKATHPRSHRCHARRLPLRRLPSTCSGLMLLPSVEGSCLSTVRVHGFMPASSWRPHSSSESHTPGRSASTRGDCTGQGASRLARARTQRLAGNHAIQSSVAPLMAHP